MLDKLNVEKTPQQHVDDWLFEQTNGIVQSGPFKGMKLLQLQAWDSGAISPMLLGCHEEELHPALEQEITRLETLDNPKIVNVGCAEGYYAIGLALRLPRATVWAIDVLEEALQLASDAAFINGAAIVIKDDLSNAFAEPDLIVMDCEGHEVVYLDPVEFPGLVHATIIVELHNMPDMPVPARLLTERFLETHTIEVVSEGARNPNQFQFLWNTPSALRWMCVCENRPCFMNYFVMRPK